LNLYNFVRPHQALGYKTPVEKFEEYIKKHQGVYHVLNENKDLTTSFSKIFLEIRANTALIGGPFKRRTKDTLSRTVFAQF
jgi:hypothetical protein